MRATIVSLTRHNSTRPFTTCNLRYERARLVLPACISCPCDLCWHYPCPVHIAPHAANFHLPSQRIQGTYRSFLVTRAVCAYMLPLPTSVQLSIAFYAWIRPHPIPRTGRRPYSLPPPMLGCAPPVPTRVNRNLHNCSILYALPSQARAATASASRTLVLPKAPTSCQPPRRAPVPTC